MLGIASVILIDGVGFCFESVSLRFCDWSFLSKDDLLNEKNKKSNFFRRVRMFFDGFAIKITRYEGTLLSIKFNES